MYDRFKRKINYLRISVTDLCNLRCTYCMPAEGIPKTEHSNILSLEEIRDVVVEGRNRGINKVRLTGGEPLVRKGILDLVSMLAAIEGIDDLSITTNGILLEKYAQDLKKAGLKRVNVSLDSLSPRKYFSITRGGDVKRVLAGIEAARAAGLEPIKINFVKLKSVNDEDAEELKKFCAQKGLELRFIQQMDLAAGQFDIVEGGDGGNCAICNRLRLTSTGYLQPCLFSDIRYNVRQYGISQAYDLALANKPARGTYSHDNRFYNVGG